MKIAIFVDKDICTWYFLTSNESFKKLKIMKQLKISKQITNRETEALGKYLQEIGRFDLLTAEEEVDLAQKIRKGDQKAIKRMVTASLRFVVTVSKQYQNRGLPLPDLINEGNLGLIKAAKRFDETRGFKFISYAVWWIRQSILQALAEQSRVVRLPLNKIGSISKINKTIDRLEQDYEREPTADEIAAALDLSTEDIKEAIRNSARNVSLDSPMSTSEDHQSSLLDVMENQDPEPDDVLIRESLRSEIERALHTLTEREADIVRLYFGLSGNGALTLGEIGERFDLSRERVRQIKENAVRRLKHTSRNKILRTYLG